MPGTLDNTSSGSPTSEPAPDYPTFPDGDVLIVSNTGRIWKLHSDTLKNASTVLRDLLDSTEAVRSTKRIKKDSPKNFRWKIHMFALEENPEETRLRTFKIVDNAARQPIQLPQNLNGRDYIDPPYNVIYDNLFRSLYSLDLHFRSSSRRNIDDFIVDTNSLLKAAEYLGAGPAIRIIIEANFLRLDQALWKHVARNSAAWTHISLRLQSPTIFRAAMAHVVGRFDLQGRDSIDKNFLQNQPNGALLVDFATKKAAELMNTKLRVERLLLEYFPERMQYPATATFIPSCDAYRNHIYLWQALTLIRQYMTSAMLSNMHHCSSDGGAYFYKCINDGGESYLSRSTLERFHEKFVMNTNGQESLRMAIDFIKNEVRAIVKPLLEDGSHISARPDEAYPRYLTCSKIEDEELPWMVGGMNYEDNA